MSNITALEVSLNKEQEKDLLAQGYCSVPGDMNKGTEGKKTNLWYKRGKEPGITSIQFSFNEKMSESLKAVGYIKINKNLNEGAGGNPIYLWYYKGTSECGVRIMALHVTTQADDEAEMFGLNWERLTCDLNRRAGGTSIHLWVRRKPTAYVCDVTANADFNGDVELLKQGYIRLEANTNRDTGGDFVFIWYRQTEDPQKAVTLMEVSTSDEEYLRYQVEGFTPVNTNLNQGNKGSPVYMWYKKEKGSAPIRDVTVINNCDVIESYKHAGVRVIDKDLNTGNSDSSALYLCYYQ